MFSRLYKYHSGKCYSNTGGAEIFQCKSQIIFSLGIPRFISIFTFWAKTHQDAHVYACVAAEVLFAPHTPIQGYSVMPFKVKIIIT